MPLAKYSFEAIGTLWSVETAKPLTRNEKQHIHNLVEAFDKTYSRFRQDSLVQRMWREGQGRYEFPRSIVRLISLYQSLAKVSHGAINPLVGASLERLGYDADYSLIKKGILKAPDFGTTVQLSGTTVATQQPVIVDVGAIGKGYLVDEIAHSISRSHSSYVIDGSGDIAVHVATPEVVGLEHPQDPSKVIGTVNLRRGSLCASAVNRRAWGNGLHHIIDATTGEPARTDIIATWAIASTTVLADALTTGLFFAAPDVLREEFGDFQYVIMNSSGAVKHNLPPEIGEVFV